MLTKEQIEAIRKNPAWHSSVTDQLWKHTTVEILSDHHPAQR